MPFFYSGDPFVWGVLLVMLLGVAAQARVNSIFRKYGKTAGHTGKTGSRVARELLDKAHCTATVVEAGPGNLTDHFDPRSNVVRLSQEVYGHASVAAVGVAAHECGHVMQQQEAYLPYRLRSGLVPVANFGSMASVPLFFIGLFLSLGPLVYLGIALFGFAVLFQLVTLPVELNASSRALRALQEGQYLNGDEIKGARSVLRAAAMTYVVAALMSVVQLLRLISVGSRRR